MSRMFSVSWWISMFISTMITIFFIWLIKKATSKVAIPGVSKMVEEV